MKKKTGLIILSVLLVIGIAVTIFLIYSSQQKADRYQQALRLMDSGDPNEAYRLFKQLGNYPADRWQEKNQEKRSERLR